MAKPSKAAKSTAAKIAQQAKYPRHTLEQALRIPAAIIDQNAGKECTDKESATFVGVGYNGPYTVQLGSAVKYGFLERKTPGHVEVTDRARRALRPQDPTDELAAYREAVLDAPVISDVYKHYRGENLPDRKFFDHALTDRFQIPAEKTSEFYEIFIAALKKAGLVEQAGDKMRILDVASSTSAPTTTSEIKRLSSKADITSGDSCFVMMPFADPLGAYYQTIFEPAITKAGLRAVRADDDIFATGKIMDQVWRGIKDAKVLVAVLTGRNPNVFYELGLAHALEKPVVLVSSNEEDVPFDLHHIRVIYYDTSDPFWGTKLIEKVAENILSAVTNPEEAVFQTALRDVA